jgi:nucleotide-binding universal stress UspA family protein
MVLKLDTILCTTDLSPHAEYILGYAINLARRFKARLPVFHAVYAPHEQPDGAGLAATAGVGP